MSESKYIGFDLLAAYRRSLADTSELTLFRLFLGCHDDPAICQCIACYRGHGLECLCSKCYTHNVDKYLSRLTAWHKYPIRKVLSGKVSFNRRKRR